MDHKSHVVIRLVAMSLQTVVETSVALLSRRHAVIRRVIIPLISSAVEMNRVLKESPVVELDVVIRGAKSVVTTRDAVP